MSSIYFNESHQQFRDAVREFFEAEVDAVAWERAQQLPKEIWRKMGELGFLGITFPGDHGGGDADIFYAAAYLEELGRTGLGGFSAAVGVQQFVVSPQLHKFGGDDLKRRFLEPSIRGDMVGALAISEPDVGSDVANLRTTAVRDGDEFVINGAKMFITNGVSGDFVIVAARTGEDGAGGISLIVVERDRAGFDARPLEKMGWHCSDTGALSFEDVRVPVANLLGELNRGFYMVMECFQLERLVVALTGIGGAEAALDATKDYIRSRQAFGRPVGKFQVVRHKLVDLATELEAAKQLTYHAAHLYQQGLHPVRECSMAKLKMTELGKVITDECLQCFGGYGFMEEYPIARMYRDARAATLAGGSSEIMKEILAKIELDGVAYSAPSAKPDTEAETSVDAALAKRFESLPDRFHGDPNLRGRFHFDFREDASGSFTVILDDGRCVVETGLHGEPDCVVTTAGETYHQIQAGTLTPQEAFMAGRIQVTSIPLMMAFRSAFQQGERESRSDEPCDASEGE